MSSSELPGDVVRVSETGRGRFQVEAHIGEACLLIDEPVESGGLGSGPDPYDLIGSALGACTAMTLRLYAGRKGWPLKRVHVEVRHRRDGLHARDVFETGILLEGDLDERPTGTPEANRRALSCASDIGARRRCAHKFAGRRDGAGAPSGATAHSRPLHAGSLRGLRRGFFCNFRPHLSSFSGAGGIDGPVKHFLLFWGPSNSRISLCCT